MKNAIKLLFLLLFIICQIVIQTDNNFMNYIHSHQVIECELSDTDISNQLSDSHSTNFEDDFLLSVYQIKPSVFVSNRLLLTFPNENYQNSFPNSIWQPPKSI